MKIFKCLNCGAENKWRGSSYKHKYCNNSCQQEFQYKEYIKEWKLGLQDGMKGSTQTSRHLKRYILEKQDGKCAICGISDWLNQKIQLELDHVNGCSEDNSEQNLRCLCPNCHSQTPTYKAKNKGYGREARRKKLS